MRKLILTTFSRPCTTFTLALPLRYPGAERITVGVPGSASIVVPTRPAKMPFMDIVAVGTLEIIFMDVLPNWDVGARRFAKAKFFLCLLDLARGRLAILRGEDRPRFWLLKNEMMTGSKTSEAWIESRGFNFRADRKDAAAGDFLFCMYWQMPIYLYIRAFCEERAFFRKADLRDLSHPRKSPL